MKTYFQGDPSHYDPPPKPPLTPYEAIMERGDPSSLCVRRET